MFTTIKIKGKNIENIKEFYRLLKDISKSKKYLCTDEVSWDLLDLENMPIKYNSDKTYELYVSGYLSDNYDLGNMFLSTGDTCSKMMYRRTERNDNRIVSFEEVSVELDLEIYARNTYLDDDEFNYCVEDLLVKNGEVKYYDEHELYVRTELPNGDVDYHNITDYIFFD